MGNKGPLAGKKGKAKNDQYKMDLGPSLPPKQSYKTKVKPFQPADDSLDDPQSAEEMDETTQAAPKQAQGNLTGNSHRKMHQQMNALEDENSNSNDMSKNQVVRGGKKPKNHPGDAPRNSKRLSMF